MAAVVSKTEETNVVSTYYVSAVAGPKVARQRVSKGDALQLTEHQARGELATGALVTSKDRVDDPWGDKAAAAKKAEADAAAAAEAKAAEDADADAKAKAAADAQAAADKAAAEAAAAQHHDDATAH